MRRFSMLVSVLVLVGTTTAASAAEVMVYAAVSLTEALQENAAAYTQASGDVVRFNFGASSTLARQIQEGAPADLFFSADEAKMDDLEKRKLLLTGSRRSLLSNVLAIVVETGSTAEIHAASDLGRASIRHIAIAEPATVPAGIYAKQYLKSAGLWNAVIDKIVPTENVRAALAAVESGNCEAGIVYRTDAQVSKRVQIAYEVPRETGPRISYPIAVVASTKQPDAARKFLDYLGTEPALAVFVAHGFLILADTKP